MFVHTWLHVTYFTIAHKNLTTLSAFFPRWAAISISPSVLMDKKCLEEQGAEPLLMSQWYTILLPTMHAVWAKGEGLGEEILQLLKMTDWQCEPSFTPLPHNQSWIPSLFEAG